MDIEKSIRKILWGKSIVKTSDENLQEDIYILRSLTIAEQNELDFIYETNLNEALSSNVLSNEELESFYCNNDIWGESDEKEIVELKKEINKLSRQRSKIRSNKVKIKVLTRKIDSAYESLGRISNYKNDLFSVSAEKYAEEIMNRHMIYMSATKKDGTPMWANEDEYLDSTDSMLIFNLTNEYIKNNLMSEKDLRRIARSGAWRYRWSASKNGESLFGKPISDWSYVQNSLVYWSQYYDYVFESPDKPDNRTLEDDAALDKWVEDQGKESKKGSLGNKNKKTGEFIEEFVIIEDADPEAIKEVYDENTSTAKKIIEETNKKIKEQGRVKDWYAKKDFRKGKAQQ